jgi:hypothetical protein
MYCANATRLSVVAPFDPDGTVSRSMSREGLQFKEASHVLRLAVPFIKNNPSALARGHRGLKNCRGLRQRFKKYERLGEWIQRLGWERFSAYRHTVYRAAYRRFYLRNRELQIHYAVQV